MLCYWKNIAPSNIDLHNIDKNSSSAGGGLISGLALAAKSINPNVKIVGAEPTGADDSAQSKLAGYIIPMLHPDTIADGLRASLGDLTWYASMFEFDLILSNVTHPVSNV